MNATLATTQEAGLNASGALWTAGLIVLVALSVYVWRRRSTGRTPVNAVVAIIGGGVLLTLMLGLAGLVVGAVVFGLYELSRVASR